MFIDIQDLIEELKEPLRDSLPRRGVSIVERYSVGPSAPSFRIPQPWVSERESYCPECVTDRLMEIQILKCTGIMTRLCRAKPVSSNGFIDLDEFGPSLLILKCEQCDLMINVIMFDREDGPTLALFPNKIGGLALQNTPPEIRHFLNQALRCQSVGATGAAVAMFRVALEQLLDNQGFKTGMLDKKIQDLAAAIQAGTAPRWAQDLDIEMLHVLKKLGNAIVHPKDVSKLRTIDNEVVIGVRETLIYLLFEIFERPAAGTKLLTQLKDMQNKTK